MNEDQLQYCINICWSCRDTSQKALYNHYFKLTDKNFDATHIKLMTDCIQICQTTADFMTRNSQFNEQIGEICAIICEACSDSCRKYDTEEMQHCADLCRKCANYCRGKNLI